MRKKELIDGEHVIEGFSKVISTFLNLKLLPVDLILNVINSLVELGDVHLSILKSAFSSLVLLLDGKDFVLQLLLSLNSLLGRLFKRFHVLTNSLKLLLNSLQLIFSKLCTVNSSLQFILLNSKLP